MTAHLRKPLGKEMEQKFFIDWFCNGQWPETEFIPNYFTLLCQVSLESSMQAGLQLKTQIIFQIAVLIYKAKQHMEPECIPELVSSKNIGKMQKNILCLNEIAHMKGHSNLFNSLLLKKAFFFLAR